MSIICIPTRMMFNKCMCSIQNKCMCRSMPSVTHRWMAKRTWSQNFGQTSYRMLDLSQYAAAMRADSFGAFLGEGSIQRKHDCSVCIDLPLPSPTFFCSPFLLALLSCLSSFSPSLRDLLHRGPVRCGCTPSTSRCVSVSHVYLSVICTV